MATPVQTVEELQERINKYGRPPTTDDVSVTWDGRRLDTKEKLLAFLAEVAEERAAQTPKG
jgi:hypothetical protein